MFSKRKLMEEGVPAQALVLGKKVYASGYSTGEAKVCSYHLRVKFEDGSTAEISRRVWTPKLGHAVVGDLIPVRYDPEDRSKIEIDGDSMKAQRNALAQELNEQAIASGEQRLDQS